MVVEKGYKQTEVGVIPEDWELQRLVVLSKKIGDGIHSTPVYDNNGEYFFVNGNNLINGTIVIYDETKKVNKAEYMLHKRDIDNSTLLISINGTIGNIAFYNNEKIILGKSAAYINLNDKLDKSFLFQLIQIESIKKYFENELTGTTIKNLGLGSIRNTPIPLPPLHEQTAIANALSDMDALIAQTEKLIEKKKAIKQGVMQELLKPKAGWVTKKLGEVCEILDNIRKPLNDSQRQEMKGDIPYCGANGIVGYVNDFLIDDDIILMAEDGGYFDEYKTRPVAYRFTGKCWVNNHVHILKSKKEYDQDFVFYSLVHKNILDFINGGTRAKLNKSEMLNITINIPLNKNVQTKIADTINEIGDYLYKAETKLQKLKNQKQGMMQALLTGKIRLV